MSDAPIKIVDDDNQVVGSATKQEAWAKGLIHQVVRLTIEDGKGNMLVQKRAMQKEPFPGCWDNSAAGHVDVGETYEQAIEREVFEELGLKDQKLEVMGDYYVDETWDGRIMKRHTRSYKLIHPGLDPANLHLPPEEVAEVRWMPITEVKKMVAEQPDQVTDGLRQVTERFY